MQDLIHYHIDSMQALFEKNSETLIVCRECPGGTPTLPLSTLRAHLMTVHSIDCRHKCIYCFATFKWKQGKRASNTLLTSYFTFVKHRHECLQNLLLVNASNNDWNRIATEATRPVPLMKTDASVSLGKKKWHESLSGAKQLRIQTLDQKWKFHRHLSETALLEWRSFRHSPEQSTELTKDEENQRLRQQLEDTQDALQDARQQLLCIQDLLQDIQEKGVTPSTQAAPETPNQCRVSIPSPTHLNYEDWQSEFQQFDTPENSKQYMEVIPSPMDYDDFLGPTLCIDETIQQ
ncbi:hypothetical protein JTE90_027179 [Oedothorax gibbosus]|uniref:C2H2-type domain-containing protein n=1 Tax=Oedothorax gibbosus TaxID=931172 RepID=A0AAV6TI25_9ARAC|nr:hypothetical protein JTE90_027179 [Oedothorax gibbosus]